MTDDPEFVGKFPIRQDIEILPADKPKTIKFDSAVIVNSRGRMSKRSRLIGWTVYEKIGIGVINTRALSKLSITKEDL